MNKIIANARILLTKALKKLKIRKCERSEHLLKGHMSYITITNRLWRIPTSQPDLQSVDASDLNEAKSRVVDGMP
jgi:hypothetical protein